MKKVLVIGGSGFIGRNLVETLINRGDCHVTSADIKSNSKFTKIREDTQKSDRFNEVIGDFSLIKTFSDLDTDYDEVYMLAAVVGVNKTLQNPAMVIRVNTLLTMNTLQWIEKNPIKKLVFSSSSENYAGTSDLFDIKIPTSEEVPMCISDIKHPRWTYAVTKIHGESSFIHSSNSLNFQCSIVRYQNIIGPEMGFGHAVPHIVERFIKKIEEPIKIYGYNQTRSFCYVDDAVDGTIKAMESNIANGNIYHIGNQEEINMEELTKYIGNILNYQGEYEYAPTYPGSVSRRCPDINKAINDLNYSPSYSWQDAVKNTVEWYLEYFSKNDAPSGTGFKPPEAVYKK